MSTWKRDTPAIHTKHRDPLERTGMIIRKLPEAEIAKQDKKPKKKEQKEEIDEKEDIDVDPDNPHGFSTEYILYRKLAEEKPDAVFFNPGTANWKIEEMKKGIIKAKVTTNENKIDLDKGHFFHGLDKDGKVQRMVYIRSAKNTDNKSEAVFIIYQSWPIASKPVPSVGMIYITEGYGDNDHCLGKFVGIGHNQIEISCESPSGANIQISKGAGVRDKVFIKRKSMILTFAGTAKRNKFMTSIENIRKYGVPYSCPEVKEYNKYIEAHPEPTGAKKALVAVGKFCTAVGKKIASVGTLKDVVMSGSNMGVGAGLKSAFGSRSEYDDDYYDNKYNEFYDKYLYGMNKFHPQRSDISHLPLVPNSVQCKCDENVLPIFLGLGIIELLLFGLIFAILCCIFGCIFVLFVANIKSKVNKHETSKFVNNCSESEV